MRKLLFTLVTCLVSLLCFNTAQAQLYVTGINGNWTMPAPMTVTANADGNYEFKTSTEFKMSTTNGSNWDNDFNPNALIPATTLSNSLQTQTVALKKDGGPNFMLPYGNGGVEFTITVTSDFSKVTVTGATPPVAGEYTKLYLAGTNSNWGFTNDWMFTTTDGNLYYMEGKTLANNTQLKVAGNNWSPNYGDGGALTINKEATLVQGSNPANCTLAVGGSNLTISFNVATKAFLISNEGKKVGDGTDANPYENIWVNCRGDFNNWTDNGVHPNPEGIATFSELPIGTSEFEIKYYETQDIYYGTSTPVQPNQWVQLQEGTDHMTIANATPNASYEVQFNVNTHQIYLTPVKVDYPEKMYILGEANGNTWASNVGVTMTGDGNGVYTAENVTLQGTGAEGYFSFSENLTDDWGTLIRWGSAATEGENTAVVLGQAMPIASGEKAFYAPNGTYNFSLNLATKTVTLTAGEAPAPVIPDVLYLRTSSDEYQGGQVMTKTEEVGTQGEIVYAIKLDEFSGSFKITQNETDWDGLDFGGNDNNLIKTSGQTEEAWNKSSNNFNVEGTHQNVVITFYYNSTSTPSYVKVEWNDETPAPTVPEAWYFYTESDWGKGTAMAKQEEMSSNDEYVYVLKLDELTAPLSFKIFPNAEGQGEPNYGAGAEGTFNGPFTREAFVGGGNFVNEKALTDVTISFYYKPEGRCWLQLQGTEVSEPEQPEEPIVTLYMIGDVNDGTWAANNGVSMDYEGDEQFRLNDVQIGSKAGDAYFSFAVSLGSDAGDWDGMGKRFAAIENNYQFEDINSGEEIEVEDVLQGDDPNKAFMVPAGKYNVFVSIEDKVVQIQQLEVLKDENPEPGGEVVPFDATYVFNTIEGIQKADPSIPAIDEWPSDGNNKKYEVEGVALNTEYTSFVVNRGTATNTAGFYDLTNKLHYRIYTGNTITVSALNGGKLTEIVFGTNGLNSQINKMEVASGSVGTLANNSTAKIMTWTAPEGQDVNSVTFNVTGTIYVATVDVNGETVEGGETPTPEAATWKFGGPLGDQKITEDLTVEDGIVTYTGKITPYLFNFKKIVGETTTYYGPASQVVIYNLNDFDNQAIEGSDTYWELPGDVTNGSEGAVLTFKFNTETLQLSIEPEAEPAQPVDLYFMGAGTGLTWEQFPGMKVSPAEDGTYTVTIDNLASFKMSTNEATGWDNEGGFNEGAIGYSGTYTNDVFNANGMTVKLEAWGDNQTMPFAGSYTLTINADRTEMNVKANFEMPVEAPAVYIIGTMSGWAPQDAYQLENTAWDAATSTGTWTWEGSIAAGASFKIADKNWAPINYGMDKNASSIQLNTLTDLKYNNDSKDIVLADAFDGKVTFTITGTQQANVIFEMEGPAPTPEQFYVIGTIPGMVWSETDGIIMEMGAEGIYTAEQVELVEDGGFCGFGITANMGSWSAIDAFRFGPQEADAPAIIGENPAVMTGNSWSIEPGTYTMVFNYNTTTLTISKYEAPEPPIMGDEIEAQFNFTDLNDIYKMNPSIPTAGTAPWEYNSSANWYALQGTVLTMDNITLTATNGTATNTSWTTRAAIRNAATSTTYRMPKGTELVVAAPEGYEITEIVFGGSSDKYVSYVALQDGQTGTMTASAAAPWTNTWTPAATQALAARAIGAPNEVYFTSTGGGIIQSITVKAQKLAPEAPKVPRLELADFEIAYIDGSEADAVVTDVPVNIVLEEGETINYAGFQFDLTLPAGVSVTGATVPNGAITFAQRNADNNVWRFVTNLNGNNGEGYAATENIALISFKAPNSALVRDEYPYDEPVVTSNVRLSDVLGNDMTGFFGATSTMTIIDETVHTVSVTVKSVSFEGPSYTTVEPVDMITEATEGENLLVVVEVVPEDTTDDLTYAVTVDGEANTVVTVTEGENENEFIVDTTGLNLVANETAEVTVTFTSGDKYDSFTVTVWGVQLGDSNFSHQVTVADVVTTANFIAGTLSTRFDYPNANVIENDADEPGVVDGISVQDITATIDIIMGVTYPERGVRRNVRNIATNDVLSVADFKVNAGGLFSIPVALENSYEYTALSAVVEIPTGMTVKNVTLGARAAGHNYVFNMVDGKLNVVIFSYTNATFADVDGSLFNIEVVADEDCGNINVDAVRAADVNSNGYTLGFTGGENQTGTTGINGIDADNDGVRYFTVDGIEVFNPEKGQILIRVEGNKAEKVVY